MTVMRTVFAWRWVLGLLLVITMPLVWSGCGEEKPTDEEQAAEAQQEEHGGHSSGGEDDEDGDGPHFAHLSDQMRNLPYEEITIQTHDRLYLYGRLYDPSQGLVDEEEEEITASDEEEDEPPQYPLVILLHPLNGNYMEWGDLPFQLVKNGYAVFAPDLRGHGRSIRYPGKRKQIWRTMTAAEWKAMPKDITSILQFFSRATEDYPQVDTRRVALVGANFGANLALNAASQNRSAVKAVVLLSPGMEYKGLNINPAVLYYQNPLMIMAGQEDPYVSNAAELMYKWAQGPKSIRIYRAVGQGADMLKADPSIMQEVVTWLNERFPAIPYTPPPPPEEAEEDEGEEDTEE